MTTTFEWHPEPNLLDQVMRMAQQQGKSPEAIITQAVLTYVQSHSTQNQGACSRGQQLVDSMRGKATANLSTDDIMALTRHTDD